MISEETLTGEVQGTLLTPARTAGVGVVVLTGSSGRVDVARASLFAPNGAVGLALRWFGGDGLSPIIHQVPLEVFVRATDRLVQAGCERTAYIGTSRGAEAALLVAIEKARARAIVVAGADDALWPSDLFARTLAHRLEAAEKPHVLLIHPKAGHRVLLPGETTPRSAVNAHGGSDEADQALGLAAWNEISRALQFDWESHLHRRQ